MWQGAWEVWWTSVKAAGWPNPLPGSADAVNLGRLSGSQRGEPRLVPVPISVEAPRCGRQSLGRDSHLPYPQPPGPGAAARY